MDSILSHISLAFSVIAILSLVYAMLKKRVFTARIKSINERKESLKTFTAEEILSEIKNKNQEINDLIAQGKGYLAKLQERFEESRQSINQIDVGLVPPIFRFDDSDKLQSKVRACRDKQFDCIKAGRATIAFTNWDWFGSRSDGARMIQDYRALLLGAFNSEFEVIRRQMRASTFDTAVQKLIKLIEQLRSLGETAGISIAREYAELKIEELKCWHDELKHREELKQQRREQQALLRAQNRGGDDTEELEEEIATRDTELNRAKRKAEILAGEERARLELRIEEIKAEKERLEEKFKRATSQAQITKAGYVYVISNEGSFGNDIVKIGMTRRLEPMERVNELGDASVPFRFDVHALAFVNDAPSLERALHDKFNQHRVNTENLRKEFFRVSAIEVKVAMEEMGIETDWYLKVEAKEFYESLLIKNALARINKAQNEQVLPEVI